MSQTKKTSKTSSRKTQPKRRKQPHRASTIPSKPPKQHIVLRLLSFVVLIGALASSGYLIGTNDKEKPQEKSAVVPAARKAPPKLAPSKSARRTKKRHPSPLEILQYGFAEDAQGDVSPDISWYVPGSSGEDRPRSTPRKSAVTSPPKSSRTPRLAIIIDDISHKRQLDAIKALPYHITPSIFPPSELSAESHRLTRYVKHYMVHLPMESDSAAMNRMRGMLFARSSRAKMEARVDEIRRLFPHAKYINNHTGSVFTSNYKAMKQLYGLLRQKGFVFVDSRTTARTVVRKIAHTYHDTYIARDVFIDNTLSEAYVLQQLKKAVAIARKRGFAIAIGHPHPVTMRALRHAGKVLSGVQTVYIDELYR